jgi:hypothetical protein
VCNQSYYVWSHAEIFIKKSVQISLGDFTSRAKQNDEKVVDICTKNIEKNFFESNFEFIISASEILANLEQS